MMHGRAVEKVAEGGYNLHMIMALEFREYEENHDGAFPALLPQRGVLIFERNGLRPMYRPVGWGPWPDNISGAMPVVVSEFAGKNEFLLYDYISAERWIYLGYAVTNEAEGRTLIDALKKQLDAGINFEADLKVEPGKGTLGTDTIFRLHRDLGQKLKDKGVDASLVARVAHRIPALMDRPGRYPISGAWVMYLDRHYQFVPYPGPFPMTSEFISALGELTPMKPDVDGSTIPY